MINSYKIIGDVVIIYFNCKKKLKRTLINLDDFHKIKDIKARWYGMVSSSGKVYVRANFRINGKQTTRLLHQFLIECPKGYVIDHRNQQTKDNRKQNLIICEHFQNLQNRGVQVNNKLGVRNVHYVKKHDFYIVQVNHGGKKHYGGCFKNLDDAIIKAEKMRKEFNFIGG